MLTLLSCPTLQLRRKIDQDSSWVVPDSLAPLAPSFNYHGQIYLTLRVYQDLNHQPAYINAHTVPKTHLKQTLARKHSIAYSTAKPIQSLLKVPAAAGQKNRDKSII